MKVLCFRYPRNIVTDILICLLCIFIINLILVSADSRAETVCGTSDDNIASFLDANGWVVDFNSRTVTEKIIPLVFDETYEEYELLQNKQGFSLAKYKGKTISVITFMLKNYPEYETSDNIYINILLFDNTIIGADILCTSINGFITGAVRDGNYQNR